MAAPWPEAATPKPRPLIGSQWEAETAVDGLGFPVAAPAGTPAISISGRGFGVAASGQGAATVHGALLQDDAFLPAARLDTLGAATGPGPAVAVGENESYAVAWRRDGGSVRGRYRVQDRGFEAEAELARPELGEIDPAAGFEAAADRAANVVVAFVQGTGAGRALTAAVHDRTPGRVVGLTSTRVRRGARPKLTWRPPLELWGALSFRVLVDGAQVGTTTESSLVVPARLSDGGHRWEVLATDRRGQETRSARRTVRVDGTPPSARLRVQGRRRAGSTLKFLVAAGDGRRGSGLKAASVRFGDGARAGLFSSSHAYRRAGRYTVLARVVDQVGNATRVTSSVRITAKRRGRRG